MSPDRSRRAHSGFAANVRAPRRQAAGRRMNNLKKESMFRLRRLNGVLDPHITHGNYGGTSGIHNAGPVPDPETEKISDADMPIQTSLQRSAIVE